MRKYRLFGLALGLAAMPVAALAQDGAKLDCVYAGTDASLKQLLGESMAKAGNAPEDEQLFDRFGAVARTCIAAHSVAKEQSAAYVEYSLSRILREWAIGELGMAKLSPFPIDKALEFGPGRRNHDTTAGVTDDQVSAVSAAYAEAGIDIETLDENILTLIGTYIGASSKYWNQRAALTQ